MTYTVTITESKTDGQAWKQEVEATDKLDARTRAIRELFGDDAGFVLDAGLPRSAESAYGQIMRSAAGGGQTSVTDRVRVDVEAVE